MKESAWYAMPMMQLFSRKRRTIYTDNYTNSARSAKRWTWPSIENTKSIIFAKDLVRCKLVVTKSSSKSHNSNQLSRPSEGLKKIIWANEFSKRIARSGLIYKTWIRPVMTYGMETSEDTNKTKRNASSSWNENAQDYNGKSKNRLN